MQLLNHYLLPHQKQHTSSNCLVVGASTHQQSQHSPSSLYHSAAVLAQSLHETLNKVTQQTDNSHLAGAVRCVRLVHTGEITFAPTTVGILLAQQKVDRSLDLIRFMGQPGCDQAFNPEPRPVGEAVAP